MRRSATASACSPAEWCAASYYGAATWWPPSKRVLYVLKTITVAVSATASVLMLIPAAAWQRQVSAVMGMEGPNTLGYTRTLIIAVLVGGVCVAFCPGDSRSDQDHGAVVDSALAPARRDGVVHRHRDRRRAGDHPHQRCADPRLLRRCEPGVPAAEHHHPGRHRATATGRTVRQPNVFRAMGDSRVRGPQLRRHRPSTRTS